MIGTHFAHPQTAPSDSGLNGFALRRAENKSEEVLKHTATPDAPAPGLTRYPKVSGSCAPPNSGCGCTSSSGLLARDEVACPVQAVTESREVQHGALKLVYIDPFVKPHGRGVAECPASVSSPGSRDLSLVSTMWMASASSVDLRRAAYARAAGAWCHRRGSATLAHGHREAPAEA